MINPVLLKDVMNKVSDVMYRSKSYNKPYWSAIINHLNERDPDGNYKRIVDISKAVDYMCEKKKFKIYDAINKLYDIFDTDVAIIVNCGGSFINKLNCGVCEIVGEYLVILPLIEKED